MNVIKHTLGIVAMAASVWVGSGCQDFLEVNTNPNLPQSSPANLLLPSIEGSIGYAMGSSIHRYTMLFSQQLAAQNGRQTEAYDAYTISSTEVDFPFRQLSYAGPLADIEKMLLKDPKTTHPFYFGISKILKAYYFAVITDLWGDIPYKEAFQGIANLQPKPDPSKEIYEALIKLLDEAIVDFAKPIPPATPAPGVDDYLFSGNAQRWIKTANTLKLRLYLHMLNAQAVPAATVAEFIRANETQFMSATTDDFLLRFETTATKQNPIHQFIISRTDDIAVGKTIVDLMNGKSDPRRAAYFTPAPFSPALYQNPPNMTTGGYLGLANGTGGNQVRNTFSRLHTYVRGAVLPGATPPGPTLTVSGAGTSLNYDGSAPIRLLLFSEYNFIRAELALRYGAPGDAEKFYQDGIKASFTNAGFPTLAADYLTKNGTLTGSNEDKLKQLIEEKYVANFMVGVEPWNDWRRTGYPSLLKIPAAINPGNNGRVPRALPYSQQEVDANPNLTQRTTLSDRPVFWDIRTTGPQ